MKNKSSLSFFLLMPAIFLNTLNSFTFDKKTAVSDFTTSAIFTQAYSENDLSQPTNSPQSDSIWTYIARPTNTPDRLAHGVVYDPIGDMIYMFGGTPTGQAGSNVDLCQEYDPINDTWIDKALMPTAKAWIQGAIVRRKIYVVGGYNNECSAINENACYDIATNTWS
ncbi:MAG: hypothetical protein ABIK93_07140, partial [candidate division WOR-3 bacterium]